MDTKHLERFATWARRELISLVDAQASMVLASGSVPRTERPEAVRRLESEIENHGRQHIIDKVAYIWFNRIIALRFMDVRGYTDAGVVSPVQGQEGGQPEILSDAKRGSFDSDVITSKRTEDAILGLIDGTRYSTNAEGEAYAILLTEYCRYWHKFMPFMFEREGDYTELLVPPNLLADGAILSRACEVLTEQVCEDVEVIGWLYQFYISERKDEIFAGFKQNKKAGADEIPAATQLFTPHWIVRYLVENSVGRLWMLNHPESRLIDEMDYYIAQITEETDFLKISRPEELTVIDPACGSGHMLTYTFDLLYAIYEEEGYAPSDIPGLILTHNLHGTEIDPRAGALAAFALAMKARTRDRRFFSRYRSSGLSAQPNICVIEPLSFRPDEIDMLAAEQDADLKCQEFWNQFEHADTLGSLIQPDPKQTASIKTALEHTDVAKDIIYTNTVDRAHKLVRQAEILANRFAVVVANPPYMGKRNKGALLAKFVDTYFPAASADLYLAFFLRGTSLVRTGGVMAQVAMRGWLHSTAQTELRKNLLQSNTLLTLMPMANKVMPIDFETAAAVWLVGSVRGANRLAVNEVDRTDLNSYNELEPRRFSELARTAPPSKSYLASDSAEIYFNLEDYELRMLSERSAITEVACKVGLQTGDVSRFVRQWFEVSHKRISSPTEAQKWAPYAKAGGARRWYGFTDYVVNWANDGTEIKSHKSARPQGAENYWRMGIEWSDIGHHDIAARLRPEGFIFDVVAMSMFVNYDDEDRLFGLLAYMNSAVAGNLMNSISSGIHYSVGYVSRLPEPGVISQEVIDAARENVELARRDWNFSETSREFCGLEIPLIKPAEAVAHTSTVAEWVDTIRHTRFEAKTQLASNDSIIDSFFSKIVSSSAIVVPDRRPETIRVPPADTLVINLVSYAVGCMFGRYSLDEPGVILADQGATLHDYLKIVPSPTFMPDADNVIPVVNDGRFEDDIVEQFREFLRVTFGAEHFEENLRFVEEALGVKTLRDYFINKSGRSRFYEDHVRLYKKRPLYWMFSSPKGAFNALIYMHRYNQSTVSTVLNEYLREYRAKLEVALTEVEKAAAGGSAKDQKEADQLRRDLVELAEYEHDVLYPLATRQLPIDLDDGVLVNYLRFGSALKSIGLETQRKKVEGWDWPTNKLEPLS